MMFVKFGAVRKFSALNEKKMMIRTSPIATGQLPIAYTIVMLVISTLTNVFWGTVQASTYVELRQWKEGGSTEQLAEVFA